ncbi:MAG: DUF456 domain-containing protein [Methanobacteriota archaeon]|nr:MAG: DUF456 domain-containing protein [Euryarchaeota archaeon]
MGLLRRRDSRDHDRDEPRHGVYRVEVDSERRHFHEEVPFSFWASAKVIFLLSVLLWWLPQSAGYMVAGYVGGRRAGAPWKAVIAALIPVILIFGMNASYAAGYGRSQIDFLSGLPASIAAGVGSAIPFLEPYTKFVVAYLATFIEALQRLFGMGSNGYMVTIAFAYIGGIVGDQTRREIGAKDRSGATSVNIVQPIFQRLHHADREYVDREDRDEVLVPARSVRRVHATRGRGSSLSEYRKVPAQIISSRHPALPPRRHPQEEEDEEPEPVRIREPPPPTHRPREASQQTQRFVERALKNYERPHPARHHRD